MIHDRIIIGLRDQKTTFRLLKEEDLTLDKTLSICRASEIASKHLKSMKKDEGKDHEINSIYGKKRRKERAKTEEKPGQATEGNV